MKWFDRGLLSALLLVSLAALWFPHTVKLPKDNVLLLVPAECPHGVTGIIGQIQPSTAPCHPGVPVPTKEPPFRS